MSANNLAATLLATMLAINNPALADDYSTAATALCDRIKSCTLITMRRAGSSGADERLVVDALDDICLGIQQSYVAEPGGELYNYATACLWSMAVLECDALTHMKPDQPTNDCLNYRDAVAYGYR